MTLNESQLVTKIRAKLTEIGEKARPASARTRPAVVDKTQVAFNKAVAKCKQNGIDFRQIVIHYVKNKKL